MTWSACGESLGQAEGEIDSAVLADVVSMGQNVYGVDNPTLDEWRTITNRLCSESTAVAELPQLVDELGLVRASMAKEAAITSIWPIWGLACPSKVSESQDPNT